MAGVSVTTNFFEKVYLPFPRYFAVPGFFCPRKHCTMIYQTHTLPNGLRVIHRPFPSEISYCGIAVNTGARDEDAHEHGMAHFVEHMLFKGTKKRRAHHIANRMENVGGELNAYTTKEETFIYATFLPEYFERAAELLSDVVFCSDFSETQIQRERDVILDEINSYNDSPAELIFDDFENLVYRNHEIGHYILGTSQSLMAFDTQKTRNFVRRHYRPENMVLFSFGKTPFAKVARLSEKYFGFSCASAAELPQKRRKPDWATPQKLDTEKDTAQAHIMLGTPAVSMFHPHRYAFYLLNHVLGGGAINSRLNNSLREKNGLVYHVESNLTSYTDTGLLAVYAACDKKHVEKCLKLIHKELQKLRETPLTPAQLLTAKRQYKGQLGIASQNNEGVALHIAKSFLHAGKYRPLENVFARIDAVTAQEINQAADMLFSEALHQLRYF